MQRPSQPHFLVYIHWNIVNCIVFSHSTTQTNTYAKSVQQLLFHISNGRTHRILFYMMTTSWPEGLQLANAQFNIHIITFIYLS